MLLRISTWIEGQLKTEILWAWYATPVWLGDGVKTEDTPREIPAWITYAGTPIVTSGFKNLCKSSCKEPVIFVRF
jgi:hypothetical protein